MFLPYQIKAGQSHWEMARRKEKEKQIGGVKSCQNDRWKADIKNLEPAKERKKENIWTSLYLAAITSDKRNWKIITSWKKSIVNSWGGAALYARMHYKRKMEPIRARMGALSGTGGSSSDNSYSLEAPQLDWYPGNQQADSAPHIDRALTRQDRRKQRAVTE